MNKEFKRGILFIVIGTVIAIGIVFITFGEEGKDLTADSENDDDSAEDNCQTGLRLFYGCGAVIVDLATEEKMTLNEAIVACQRDDHQTQVASDCALNEEGCEAVFDCFEGRR